MRVCFPVKEASGLDSKVFGHFGSAPAFVIVDTGNGEVMPMSNADRQHEHGKCSPVKAISWHEIDCVVADGIGSGALMKLGMAGVAVYKAEAATVGENVELLRSGRLRTFDLGAVCPGHGHGSGCSH